MNFFSLDGPFQKYGTIVFDFIMINTLWLLITLFSFGTLSGIATVSMYSATYWGIYKSEGYPLKLFFSRFKKRFLITLGCSAVCIGIVLISFFNIKIISEGYITFTWLLPLYYVLIFYIIFILPYIIALLAETRLRFKHIFIYAFILAIKHLPTSILILIINALLVLGISYLNLGILILVAPATALISILISAKLFPKYDFSSLEKNELKTKED